MKRIKKGICLLTGCLFAVWIWTVIQQEPDVRSTMIRQRGMERSLCVEVRANPWKIKDREKFAETLLQMAEENNFQSVQFSEELEAVSSIVFRVYTMPYHSRWEFELQCRRKEKDTHSWEIRVFENPL